MRPARRLDDRPRLAPRRVEPVEAGIGVRLHQAAVACEVTLGMLAGAVARIEERRGGRVAPVEGLIVAHIGPQPSSARLALRQHRHSGVVGMDAFGRKHVLADRLDQRHQRCRRGAHPVGQCRDIEIDPLARIGRALAIERQVRAYLANSTCVSSAGPARPRAIGCEGAGGWVIASQARQENFSRTCWITFHWRGTTSNVSVTSSPELAQHPATARAGGRRGIDDAIARQMIRQRTARRLLAFEPAHLDRIDVRRLRRDLGRCFSFGGSLFQAGKLQLELLDQRTPLGRLSKALVAQLGDGELQLRDLQRARMRLCFSATRLRLRLRFDPRRSDATAPRSSAAATIRSFSARDQRRRR